MREYIVTYTQVYENFERTKKYQADFMNEALQRFLDEKIFVSESISIKEYETPYEITVKWYDEPDTFHYHFDTFEDMMNKACYIQAFDDCGPGMEIFIVEAEGQEIKYDGWLSGMRYRWRLADTNEIVWEKSYPEWDH